MESHKTPAMQRATPLLGRYVSALTAGDFLLDVETLDETGRSLRLRSDLYAGRPLILVFTGRLTDDALPAWMKAWAGREASIKSAGAHLIFITSDSDAASAQAIKREAGLGAPICGDPNGTLLARFGPQHGHDLQASGASRIIVISANGQVRRIMNHNPDAIDQSLETVRGLELQESEADKQGWIPGHPPVLIIPRAFDPDECRMLIDRFESTDGFRVDRPDPQDPAEYKFMASDYHRQDRVDHVLKDPALLARLDQRIAERITPQIQKAFAFQVTRRELLHVARYEGPREGIKVGHRDNTSPNTKYRRFALSVSLNDDYEGGELVFREYAGQGYRGEPGTAFIFSSSLLHEVEETTKGVRYNLISHLFDDASTQQAAR
ncbi:2OG-Fe(II) oxygenase [Maricaulis sp.]|uniref:2OG-Fe(II) oxygenase n=1 Tax=Maricaulis sp. TaxID=1486257 RepID=UPI003A900EA1